MADDSSEYTRASAEMFRTWEKAMGAWWDDVLETPAFLGAVNQSLSGSAKARGAYTQAVDKALEQAHLPTRNDLIRVARIATLLEDRLLAQEDLLLEMKDRLAAAEKETLKARIDAAETRVELGAKLDAVLDRLGQLTSPTVGAPLAQKDADEAGESAPRRRGATK